MNWLRIDVSGLIGKSGTVDQFSASDAISDLAGSLGRVDDCVPVSVDLSLRGRDDGVSVRGRVEGMFVLSCSRCLVGFGERFVVEPDEMFYLEPEQAEERDGYEVSDDFTINLEPMLRDAIVLNLPVTPVHAPDCKGLCSVCGADRNITHCEHGEAPVDHRWAALENLMVDEH